MTKISDIKANPNNPRIIKDDKFAKLVKSIKEFPEMLQIRPIVVNADMIVLGGNMRLKASKEAWFKEVPVIKATDLTEEQQREFIIKDNSGFGEWDYEMLANEWSDLPLNDWGLDLPSLSDYDEYTKKIDSPNYEPNEETAPEINALFDDSHTLKLLAEINASDLPENEKEFLRLASYRHTVFNYKNIAEYYAHAHKKTQELMENSALVIIDFKKAIELGFVKLTQDISDQYLEDHGQE